MSAKAIRTPLTGSVLQMHPQMCGASRMPWHAPNQGRPPVQPRSFARRLLLDPLEKVQNNSGLFVQCSYTVRLYEPLVRNPACTGLLP